MYKNKTELRGAKKDKRAASTMWRHSRIPMHARFIDLFRNFLNTLPILRSTVLFVVGVSFVEIKTSHHFK